MPRAIGDFLVLRAIRESGGTALTVSDADMVSAMLGMGRLEGVSPAPEGGADTDTVVLFNTGGALKYLDVLAG